MSAKLNPETVVVVLLTIYFVILVRALYICYHQFLTGDLGAEKAVQPVHRSEQARSGTDEFCCLPLSSSAERVCFRLSGCSPALHPRALEVMRNAATGTRERSDHLSTALEKREELCHLIMISQVAGIPSLHNMGAKTPLRRRWAM